MNLINFVLASAFCAKAVHCSAAIILNNDRHGAAESVFATRTLDDAMHDEILNSNSETDIRNYFVKLGNEAVKIHAPSILLKAISKSNKVAVDTLVSLGADPFKLHQTYQMTAWDLLSVIPESEMSQKQRLIKADWQRTYMDHPGMQRNQEAYKKMLNHAIIYAPRFAEFQNFNGITIGYGNLPNYYNLCFGDGSSPIQQTIIGNNFTLFLKILNEPSLNLNHTWTKKPDGIKIDIKESMNIDPIGWTALMVAVAFNRVEMVRKLLERPNIDIKIKAENADAFTLARRLPIEKREAVLKLLKAKASSATAPAGCATFINLKKAIEGGASAECLSFHLNKETVNTETLIAAVSNMTDEAIFQELFNEAENIIKTDRSIHKKLWAALKLDTKSGTVEKYRTKITKLVGVGFKIDDRVVYVSGASDKTPLEEAYTNSSLKHELALALILRASQVNTIECHQKPPIVLAIENDNAKIVKYLLQNAVTLGLSHEINCNDEKENLLHFAITWIKDEDILIEIVDALLLLKPEFLNSQSISLVKNSVSYPWNNKTISYTMLGRSKWTPLMYAVMMRKNKVAKHLIKKGANKNLKGLDNIGVDEITRTRCDAFEEGIKIKTVDVDKKKYIQEASIRITEDIKEEIMTKFRY